MNPTAPLLTVQDLDTSIDQLRHRLTHMPEQARLAEVHDELALVAAARAVAESRQQELTRDETRLEVEIEGLADKAKQVDRALYSGTVSAPRELQAMQDELAALGRRQGVLEDNVLELMVELEPVDEELRALDQQQAVLDEEAVSLTVTIAEAEASLLGEIDGLSATRAAAVVELGPELVAEYEGLRGRLGGVGAAPLIGNRCGGCHLTLSAMEVDRIRHLPPDAIVHCDECDRLLVRATQ